MKDKWFLIVNPVSGVGRCRKIWPKVHSLLKETGIDFDHVFTEYRGHAIELTKRAVQKGWRGIICMGGDGTKNEVIHGLFLQDYVPTSDITVAMIPAGIGNDWGKTIGIPYEYDKAIHAIKEGITFTQDTCLVEYYDGKEHQKRYYSNIAGMGYDALVTERANHMKERGYSGTLPYLLSLFICLIRYRSTKVKIKIDDIEIEDHVFSLNVGTCKYSGGGMMFLPDAIPDDGLLYMTVIKDLGKVEVLKNVRYLYDGTFIKHPRIEAFRGEKITVYSRPKAYIEADGESLGHSPFQFSIIPRSLKVIVKKQSVIK